MNIASGQEQPLEAVAPADRVLLLSHCLRPSQTCPAKFTKQGLECPDDCTQDCMLLRFRQEARRCGYKGVCIAAGGAMALRFVKEMRPKGIVAVACHKELEAGVDGVKSLTEGLEELPAILVVPLSKDGCVDCEVDVEQVKVAINAASAPVSQ